MSTKMYVWSYSLTPRDVDDLKIFGHLVMPTECGVTVAAKLATDYETHFVTYLALLGEVEIVNE